MWMRNLVFLGTLAVGAGALGWWLFPTAVPSRGKGFDAHAVHDPEFAGVVDEMDDLFVKAWKSAGVKPAPDAPELAVVRRTSLAFMGSVPSVQEIRQYESNAPQSLSTEERYQWWLAGIFQDRRYGDYMAERLARATAGIEDGPPFIYRRHRFTSWLGDQLMANRPYDDLVRELIATDGFSTNKPASNFIISTLDPTNGNTPNRVRMASRTARAFLGIRLDCAQCHNHPFQPWKKTDFDGLAAFYGRVNFGFSGLYEKEGEEYQVDDRRSGGKRTVQPSVPERKDLVPADGNRRQQLAAWVTHKDNPYFARATVNRMWGLLFGVPLIEPVDDIATVLLEPLEHLEPADPRRLQRLALDRLAQDFAEHDFDLRRLLRVIVALKVYRLDSASPEELTEAHDLYWAAFPMTRLRSDQVAQSLLQACSLTTVNSDSNLLTRMAFFDQSRRFVERYGDTGEDEFDNRGGTVPQRLFMMNGAIVREKTKEDFNNASARIAKLSPNDAKAIEVAYLAVLTRRPTQEELEHFQLRLADKAGKNLKEQALEDLYWTLLNSTEFAWNH
jgi:hypothetical protein